MNDKEREQWIMNDEPLYNWWRSTRQSMRQFIKNNKDELTAYINKKLNR